MTDLFKVLQLVIDAYEMTSGPVNYGTYAGIVMKLKDHPAQVYADLRGMWFEYGLNYQSSFNEDARYVFQDAFRYLENVCCASPEYKDLPPRP